MKELSINLKNLLLVSKLSESELARKTGIAQQIINRIASGENKNPKISTLSALSSYFMISISQLIGEEPLDTQIKLNTHHLGWQAIPIIDWNGLLHTSLHELLLQKNEKILIDTDPSRHLFALKMNDDSMEPKFSYGTILIFDAQKQPSNMDFVLLIYPQRRIEVRQLCIKNNKYHIKCLNPRHFNYQLTLMAEECDCIGVLIQSRTNHMNDTL